jgi:hypothetical protein
LGHEVSFWYAEGDGEKFPLFEKGSVGGCVVQILLPSSWELGTLEGSEGALKITFFSFVNAH